MRGLADRPLGKEIKRMWGVVCVCVGGGGFKKSQRSAREMTRKDKDKKSQALHDFTPPVPAHPRWGRREGNHENDHVVCALTALNCFRPALGETSSPSVLQCRRSINFPGVVYRLPKRVLAEETPLASVRERKEQKNGMSPSKEHSP